MKLHRPSSDAVWGVINLVLGVIFVLGWVAHCLGYDITAYGIVRSY